MYLKIKKTAISVLLATNFLLAFMARVSGSASAWTNGTTSYHTNSGGVQAVGEYGSARGFVGVSASGASASSSALAFLGGQAVGGGNGAGSATLTVGSDQVPIAFKVRASISAVGEMVPVSWPGPSAPYSVVSASAGASIRSASGSELGGIGVGVQMVAGELYVPPSAFGEVIISSPGDYVVSFSAIAASNVATASLSGARSSQARASVSWGLGGIPGDDKERPKKYEKQNDVIYVPEGSDEVEIDEGARDANDTTGAYLTLPLGDTYGVTDYIWAGDEIQEESVERPSWNPAYLFRSDKRVAKFKIPDALPSGDEQFELVLPGGTVHALAAGQDFDFTEHIAGGVNSFRLRGFSPNENLWASEAFPFTHGFQFANDGVAVVLNKPISIGDYTQGGIVDGDDLTVWKSTFGLSASLDADGDNNGVVDGADFLLWQRAFQASNSQAITPVPEPSTWAAGLSIAVSFLARRKPERIS